MTDESEALIALERELAQAKELMFQMAKMAEMGKMVAVVVHELSQPLLGIKAFAQILRRKFGEDEFIAPKVKMIEEQAVHMEGILDTLRQYYRSPLVTQKSVAPMQPLKAAVEMFQDRARKLRTQVVFEAPVEVPPVRGNSGHLQQVIVNLLGNALDELAANRIQNGKVLIRLDLCQDKVRLWVADTGLGIPAEVRAHIFDAFYTTKGNDKGTGLGLSICRDILQMHGGKIQLLDNEQTRAAIGEEYTTCFEVLLSPVS